ncbi:MAG: 6-carboxyhexanoate--CoA ligase [Aquificae bacterium]|nr:6-carboxyhexanoate--CoA ligase [Aquificota bacterium]
MDYFSVKMRASLGQEHTSGHERIVEKSHIEDVIFEFYKRGSRKEFDLLNIKVEKIKQPIKMIKKSLKIKDLKFPTFIEANEFAIDLLFRYLKIPKEVLESLIGQVHSGAGDKKNMRGAMIVNLKGERIEKDRQRGIRTSMVDFVNRDKALSVLKGKGFTDRTLDALAVSTKNLSYKGFLAEYCISDEADYITGYVSVDGTYFRLTPLKNFGNSFGGRIYFVEDGLDLDKLYDYLQSKPILIKNVQL